MTVTTEEEVLAAVCHLSPLLGFSTFIAPLIIYFWKRDSSAFVRQHAAESLNFQISLIIYSIIGAVLTLVLVGFLILAVVGIGALIFMVMATIAALQDKHYDYPFTLFQVFE